MDVSGTDGGGGSRKSPPINNERTSALKVFKQLVTATAGAGKVVFDTCLVDA